jgi:coenzyme F420-reducing hydrogenase alpha subunit
MVEETIIDKIYKDNQDLLNYLENKQEISLKILFDATFKKTLLLSAASYFEEEICKMVQEFVERATQNDKYIVALVKKKAIERQYHTYFQWDGNNANTFFSLFGEEFKEKLKKEIDTDEILKSSVKAFLELGATRNKLVHLNFASYPLDKTAEEIFTLYKTALVFINFLNKHFNYSNTEPEKTESANF